jgi:cytoskeletal protein CcmA (bactofilin family)
VDTQISSATIADADATTKGKIQLAGDLAGTNSSASAPVISNSAISTAKIAADAVTSAKILDGEIVNADISTTAAIADTKLATIATSGKVSNSATTATDANTASAIVARDANGNFTAGTITANLTGLASKATNINGGTLGAIPYQSAANTTTLLTGNTAATKKFLTQTGDGSAAAAPVWAGVAVSDITGTLPVANGGIGVTTTAANLVFAGPTSGATPAAPSFRSLVAADLPTGSTNYVNNGTAQQASTDFNISGSGTIGTTLDVTGNTTIGGTATITGATTLSALTATKGVFTDASKRLTSVGTLGTDQGGTGMASFNNGGAMYATSTSALTTGTLPTSAGGTGLTSYTNGGALYTTSTTAITSGTLPISAGGTGATTAAAALTSLGAQSTANLSTDVAADAASTSKYPAVKAIKDYVDTQISSATIADADATTKGKIQLAGDLAGTNSSASAPVISNSAISTAKIAADAVTTAKILDGEIVNADISTTAAIADTKLATIATSGKVSNSATTATDANTASAIVARDANGNFTAGTITANLTGNATNVTGTVAIANGGTGVATAAANAVFAGPASGASPAAPSFRGLVAADLPSGSTNYINNTTTQQSASFNISGSGTVGTDLTLSALTASKPVFTDTNRKLTSAGTLGISQGGTGLTTTPTNGQILIGNGTGFTLANLSQGTGISISTGTGSISIAAAVRPTTDQFSATANQTTFTLTQTPLTNANSKDNVWMFINGVRTNNDAYSVSGTTVTYVPGSNGSYALLANDRIQFDYMY